MGATPNWLGTAADGSEDHLEWCRTALEAYFAEPSPGRPNYSGAYFDVLGENPPDRVVADDLVAVSLLSVGVPKHAALRILGPDASRISRLLARIPTDVDLHDADLADVDRESIGEQLWAVLREQSVGREAENTDALGPVTTSKLLARKRPRLLPVWDRIVGEQLQLRDNHDHWVFVRDLLREDARRVDVLCGAHRAARLPHAVSVLRTLDVLLWMSDATRCPPPS